MAKKPYRRIWEQYHGCRIPCGYEIHHIDGNRLNNRIDNLKCVSPEEHFNIHLEQGDLLAAAAIATRHAMVDLQEINRLAGLLAYQRKAGIHSLTKEENRSNGAKGAKAIIGYKFWTDGINETKAKQCPGEGWRLGRVPNKKYGYEKGRRIGFFWNNGSINKRANECPGEGWTKGKLLNEEQRKRRQEISRRKRKK